MGPSSPSSKEASPKGHSSQFSAHICCGQMARWIKMPLGMKVGLDPGDCVRWGPSSPSPKRGCSPPIFGPCLLWPNGWMDQECTWHGGGPRSRPHCARWGPSSPPQKRCRAPSQFSAHFLCSQTAGCIKVLEVGLGLGHIVLDGDPASPTVEKGDTTPNFWPMSVVVKRLDGSRSHLVWR